MAEMLTPTLAVGSAGNGNSFAVLLLGAVLVLVFFGWKLLQALFVLINGLLGAIAKVLGTLAGALLVVVGLGALLFFGARSVDAPAPAPPASPPAEPPATGLPVWVYVLAIAAIGVLVAVGASLVAHVGQAERERYEVEAIRRHAAGVRPSDSPHPVVTMPARPTAPRHPSSTSRPAPEFAHGPEPVRPGDGVREPRRTQAVPQNGGAAKRAAPRRQRRRRS
jgi:hypothetical protein